MNPFAQKRVQINRERRYQRFALTGFHLGDFAFMQHHAAQQLHIKVAHAQRPLGCLAHRCKSLRQDGKNVFAFL
ncbi:hypothetical protein D3C85_1823580 [compost metagenome]